jgi:hypothetical protein
MGAQASLACLHLTTQGLLLRNLDSTASQNFKYIFLNRASPKAFDNCDYISRGSRFVAGCRRPFLAKRKVYGDDDGAGIMVDSGANVSTADAMQRHAVMTETTMSMLMKKVFSSLRTMGGRANMVGLGNLTISLSSLPDAACEIIDFNIVNECSPMVLPLPDVKMLLWALDVRLNVVRLPTGDLLPLYQRNGHLFVKWHRRECKSAYLHVRRHLYFLVTTRAATPVTKPVLLCQDACSDTCILIFWAGRPGASQRHRHCWSSL